MKKSAVIGMLIGISSNLYADTDNVSQQIQLLNSQIQAQLQKVQSDQQDQIQTLNKQLQTQLKQMQTNLQTQIQNSNTKTQQQLTQLQTSLEAQIKSVQHPLSAQPSMQPPQQIASPPSTTPK